MANKRGQIAIFVIVAILIVAGIGAYFVFKGKLGVSDIPEEFIPVYNNYQSCIEERLDNGIKVAESQGGRIYAGEFIPGSSYAPSGNQLDFLGFSVPYWFYITGNGIAKENVPSKSGIEGELERYVEDNLENCNLDKFYEQGFYIEIGEPEADFKINDNSVTGNVAVNIAVSKGEQSAVKKEFLIEINSKLGKFYEKALEIYNREKKDAFIENYSIDVLRNYAPVDGVEISCSGKVWKARDIADEIKYGLEANIGALKLNGNYYSLSKPENKYFVIDSISVGDGESADFIYSRDWPGKIEIDGEGSENELLIAKPVGNQKGLGAMGFCYAPYHFVYDIVFPVMVQVYERDEIFQFPFIAVVDNNVPRKGIYSNLGYEEAEGDVCKFSNKKIEVNLYDTNLNGVDANVSYSCLNQECPLGETKSGRIEALVPGCFNGYLIARADNFDEKRQLFSSNEEDKADIIIDRNYEISVEMAVGGKALGNGSAIVSFTSEGKTISAALPDSNKIRLAEGLYDVDVYVYGSSEIKIPETTKTQCVDVPSGGILAVFGVTKEKCFDIIIPETKIESALAGGGKSEIYILESELKTGKARIKVDSLPKPDSLEQLQYNYELFENGGVEIDFG